MSSCPWCDAPRKKGYGVCPSCGHDITKERLSRGFLLIVAVGLPVILVVAWVGVVYLEPQDCNAALVEGLGGCPGQSTVLGSALSLDNPQVGAGPHPTVWYENVSIEKGPATIQTENLAIYVKTANDGALAPPVGSKVVLLDVRAGQPVSVYNLAQNSWSLTGESTDLTDQDAFQVVWVSSSATDPLTGDLFVVTGENGFSGTLSVTLA